ncbi:MAG: hypothetical protein MKZ98_13880 [Pseudomonadales bacterium]|nr:hypothetical protein [Pseudomonadales bacterium]
MSEARELDQEKLQEFSGKVSRTLIGGLNSALTYFGDHLGLYTSLRDLGAATSQELADKT